MRASRIVLILAATAGIAGLAAYAYQVARPQPHPIKVADAARLAATAKPEPETVDARAPLFGPARVIDGDTLEIQGVEADLWTIKAPLPDRLCTGPDDERWACGEASRANLERLIGGRSVACRPEGPPPRDGRWLGLCFVSDVPCQPDGGACGSDLDSLNLAQVEQGWAADLEGQYADPEDVARERRIGLWRGRGDAF